MANPYGRTVGQLIMDSVSPLGDFVRRNPLESAAIATAQVPVVGDVAGLLADANMYYSKPEERTPLNYGMSLLGALPFVPAVAVAKALTPAEEMAKKVIELLKSGKSDEITDKMLEASDPAYLAKNYDLPMDTESRMARAREMGFDTDRVMYSGQQKDIKSFEQQDFWDDEPHIMWMSDNPAVAGSYIGRAKTSYETPSVFPFYVRDPDTTIEGAGANWQNLPAESLPDEFDEIDFYKGKDINTEDVISELGGSVEFRNITDVGPNMSYPQVSGYDKNIPSTTRADSDPAYNVRSKFARFDPRLEHLGNINAGIAGLIAAPVLARGLLSTNEEEQF